MGWGPKNLSIFVILFPVRCHTEAAGDDAARNSEGIEPFDTFFRMQIAARGFVCVSVVNSWL
jgi:hypothetical protein